MSGAQRVVARTKWRCQAGTKMTGE